MFTDNKTEQNKAVKQDNNTKQKRINKINKQSKWIIKKIRIELKWISRIEQNKTARTDKI